jgi:S-adenosylmethionine synthetase
MIKTAEFVSPGHPDKRCDFIADSILDAYLAGDKQSRCAIEVMGGHNLITINGEVTSATKPDITALVQNIVGPDYKVIGNIALQSREIGRGVDTGGAGDQGIMKGYATNETEALMPLEYELARTVKICKYPFDGKTQVTIKMTVVIEFQNSNADLVPLMKSVIPDAEEYLANTSGEWTQGGFDADTGLSGRKLIVDNYGPEVTIGGGSFSGKDYTKVDRSGAYMCRHIAVELLKARGAKTVHTRLAYAIGKAEPVMAIAVIDGIEETITVRPRGYQDRTHPDSKAPTYRGNFNCSTNYGHRKSTDDQKRRGLPRRFCVWYDMHT